MSLTALHNDYIHDIVEKRKTLENCKSDHEKFHYFRDFGIGGSDVSVILGINRYKTPYQLWCEKTGKTEPEDLTGNDCVHFGHALENVVAEEYARRTGQKVQRRNKAFVSKDHPWMRANIDRMVVGKNKIVECKTADKFTIKFNWGEEGTDEVPEPYILQVMHYMAVTGFKEAGAELAVLIGGNEFRTYHIRFNQEISELVNERITRFWFDNVIGGKAPNPISHNDLYLMYPYDDGTRITATPDILEKAQLLQDLKKQIKTLDNEASGNQGIIFDIKKFMGEAQILVDPEGNKIASFKDQSSNRLDPIKLRKDHPNLAKEYTKITENRPFRTFY